MQDAKIAKKSPSVHHRTTLSGYIFATKAGIDNNKKLVKQQYLLQNGYFAKAVSPCQEANVVYASFPVWKCILQS